MRATKSPAAAAPLPDSLRKRERQAVALAAAIAVQHGAFSISFDFSLKRVRTLIYFDKPSGKEEAMGEEDVEKPHEQELGASKENVSTQSPAPASAPAVATGSARLGAASSRERSAPWQVVEKKSAKGASKSASKGASKGASKVDRNALSARGTGSPKRKLEEVKPSSPAAASPQGSSPGASSLLSGGAGSMDDDPVSVEEEFPSLPMLAPPSRALPPTTSDLGTGADYTGKVPAGLPPPGLPAHVYTGKGYPRFGFNEATYGGCDPWLSKGGRGRGGGRSRSD